MHDKLSHIEIIAKISSELDDKMIEDFISLQNTVFSKNKYDRNRFLKKYTDNVYGPSVIVVAYDNGVGVGARSFLRNDIGEKLAYQPCDTCVLESHRRKGLFSMMTLKALNSVPKESLIYNFPNKNSLPGYLKLGWKISYFKKFKILISGKSLKEVEKIDSLTKKWMLSDIKKESDLFYTKKRKKFYLIMKRRYNRYWIVGEISESDTVNLRKAKFPLLLVYSPSGRFGEGIVAVTRNNQNNIDIPFYKADTLLH